MAEPVSLTLAIVPIAAGLVKALNELLQLSRDASYANRDIFSFCKELEAFKQTLHCCETTINQTPPEVLTADLLRLKRIVEREARSTVRLLENKLIPIIRGLKQPSPLRVLVSMVGWVWKHKAEVERYRSRLDTYTEHLSLFMLNVELRSTQFSKRQLESSHGDPTLIAQLRERMWVNRRAFVRLTVTI